MYSRLLLYQFTVQCSMLSVKVSMPLLRRCAMCNVQCAMCLSLGGISEVSVENCRVQVVQVVQIV